MVSFVDSRSGGGRAGRSILIVEGERLIRWSLSKALESSGYSVTVAETGQRALEHLSAGSFDLVITDVELPIMEGHRVTQRLDPDFPVIIIGAQTDSPHQQSTLVNHSYVEKPFDLKEITGLVNRLLGRAGV